MTIEEEREKLGKQIEDAYSRLAEIAIIEEKNDEEKLVNRLLELGFRLNDELFKAHGNIRYVLNIDDLTYEVNIKAGYFYVYQDKFMNNIVYEPYLDGDNRLAEMLFQINNCPDIYLVKRPDYMVSGQQDDELAECEIVKTYKLG